VTADDRADRAGALCKLLRERGERLTKARRAVIDALVASGDHLTAEQIGSCVQEVHPEVHRATIYRTLDTLTELGVTEHSHLGHGPAVYHLADELHQHMVCESCGEVREVPTSLLRGLGKRLREDYGFVMRPTHFAIVGRCRECATD
jgi:Fur family ferric uptake transcriptional regulator